VSAENTGNQQRHQALGMTFSKEVDAYGIFSWFGRSSTRKKERFQAIIAHLRENISGVIKSDIRDFSGSSYPPYQGLRPLREEE
jgi:hypothetical protein